MVKQSRGDCSQEQDWLSYGIQVIINNSPVTGFQNTFNKLATLFAWPVRDGDVCVASIPGGDVNLDGQVDAGDILIATRIALGLMTASPEQFIRGDVAPLNAGSPGPDGLINAADILLIQGKALGIVSFP